MYMRGVKIASQMEQNFRIEKIDFPFKNNNFKKKEKWTGFSNGNILCNLCAT